MPRWSHHIAPEPERAQDLAAPIAIQALVAVADEARARQIGDALGDAMPVIVRICHDAAGIAAELHDASYDVVVADVDVPGFDDPLMLRLARDTQPTAIRIGLLGRPRQEPALTALAHQVITDEDDLPALAARVRSAISLHRSIEHPVARAHVVNCDVLPGVPALLVALAAVLGDAEATMADVTDVVSTDPELAARILQLTNSAFLGRRTPTADIGAAIAWLGVPAVRALVVHLEVLRAFRQGVPQAVADLAEDLAAHGRDTANWARELQPGDPEAWTAGLLHDLGKLVLAANDPAGWASVEALTAAGQTSVAAEQAILGCDHAQVGACLLSTWGLPEVVVEAVAGHHQPGEQGATLHLAGVVHLADALVHGAPRRVDRLWVEASGLVPWLDDWWLAAHP